MAEMAKLIRIDEGRWRFAGEIIFEREKWGMGHSSYNHNSLWESSPLNASGGATNGSMEL